MMSDQIEVGSIIRIEPCSTRNNRCLVRAMVATKSDISVCIILEPIYPHPITSDNYSCCNFLITPKSINKESDGDGEMTVTIDKIHPLLPFENYDIKNNTSNESESILENSKKSAVTIWKVKGDQLLRLGDASSATSYYEKALFKSSKVSVGGTIIISVEGFPRIAEVDCVEEDDDVIDVTIVSNGEERTVKNSTALLSIMEPDHDSLQERILLNLSRCMLQLSELDIINRPKYLKSAILATTLVITISSFREQNDDYKSLLQANAQTALILRAKAYSGLSKWSKAIVDAKRLVKNGNEQQGNKLLIDIERKKKIQSKTDKKLAKGFCRMVQSATRCTANATVSATTTTTEPDLSGCSSTGKLVSSKSSYLAIDGMSTDDNGTTTPDYTLEGETTLQDKISQLKRRLTSNSIILSSILSSPLLGLCSTLGLLLPIVAVILISQYFLKKGQ